MATPTSTKIGHGLAKVLGIKLDYRDPLGANNGLSRGESVFSVSSADTYVEEEPDVFEWLRETMPTGEGLRRYCLNLFPFIHWIGRYNAQWLFGDLVAGWFRNSPCRNSLFIIDPLGITVGAVVVPQGMAYATLADLKPQFGLYTSFMGVLIYWFFATSKDITIGVSLIT